MSSTSSSRAQRDRAGRNAAAAARAPRPRSRRRTPRRRARTRPGSGGPTRSGARCTRAGCCASIRRTCSPIAAARTRCARSRPPRSPAWPASSASQIPLVGQPGLDHHARAVAVRHHQRVVLDLLEQAQRLRDRRRSACAPRTGRGRDRLRAPSSFSCASRSKMLIERQAVPLPDLEIVEIVRRRDLDRAAARLGIGVFVGDDRDQPADQRQDRTACRRDRR